jgi:N-formylglutamate amidohydrolase
MTPYHIIVPKVSTVPIVVSVPHCGVEFPDDIRGQYKQALIQAPDDTDWFVDRLYNFAQDLGMTMITAKYSRWVIDLNRDPQSKPLYSDGRIITDLCPVTTFLGEPIYQDERKEIDQEERKVRLQKYYWPYHEKLNELLNHTKSTFGKVLLWDCHSIRQEVKTIYSGKFPDFILGDADGTSCSREMIDIAYNALSSGSFHVSHNHPFKGGYITREYGRPLENQFALQLEMAKINYMDDEELKYDEQRAGRVRTILQHTFRKLINHLGVDPQ